MVTEERFDNDLTWIFFYETGDRANWQKVGKSKFKDERWISENQLHREWP